MDLADGLPAGAAGALASGTHNQITSSPGEEVSKISKPDDKRVKRMNLNVPVDLHNSFKSVTATQGKNMTDVLLEHIKDYIAKHSPKPNGRRK